MSESIVRHRGGGFDSDDNPIPWVDVPLDLRRHVVRVAPGAQPEYVDRGRNGERVQCSVYIQPAVDVGNADEVTVRGVRYQAQVELWKSGPYTGTVILCSTGRG